MFPVAIVSFSLMVIHTLLIWPMSPIGVHKLHMIQSDHLLMVVPSFTLMVIHTLLIWPMSPNGAHKLPMIQSDHLLMVVPMEVWQALMSTCSLI